MSSRTTKNAKANVELKGVVDKRAQFFSQIADPVRHSVLNLLLKEKEISVTEILTRLNKPQTLISYHLRCLKEIGLVGSKKSEDDGRKTLYSLHDSANLISLFSLADEYTRKHAKCNGNGRSCQD
ncbi:MAG: ArsR/SmtB family transcription factor [Candidatus Hodarchaeales archaeon]|jgi:DNA-binding transcriptional ArsR family regulator